MNKCCLKWDSLTVLVFGIHEFQHLNKTVKAEVHGQHVQPWIKLFGDSNYAFQGKLQGADTAI